MPCTPVLRLLEAAAFGCANSREGGVGSAGSTPSGSGETTTSTGAATIGDDATLDCEGYEHYLMGGRTCFDQYVSRQLECQGQSPF